MGCEEELTGGQWSALGLVLECAEFLKVVEEESGRTTVQIGEPINTLKGQARKPLKSRCRRI